ncbi:unnamed protein product [Alternaria alternata]|uniref:Uncharacterized protein n=1 Tax=Alternaria tenuissima TaxID=119927 RepID=A0A4Q4PHT9_9PLEO|nr:hypothetical protein AA0114_g2166 [Alternaria tenuissima]RYN85574.1 hypothetical protein AA0120_g8679 [Alternaria tenuissima]RYO02719.1 hypothetical protein AA0119_g5252 [Alternaria tenuissima]RYO15948.1 hypothetical protein AA0121_g6711 [Alternaria tenuissima]
MVYDQIVTPHKQHYVLKAHETFNDETGKLEHPFFDAEISMPEDPGMRSDVWKFVEYTGEAVGKEIAEHWYRTGRFNFDPEDCLLKRFLTTDVWHRGIVPADVVHWLLMSFNPIPYIVPTDSMEADLESLFTISNKNSVLVFKIDKQRYHAASGSRGMLSMLALIAPYVYRLRTEGFSRVAAYQDLIDLHSKPFPWKFCPWDITYFFEMEQEEFETVFRKEFGRDDERDKRIAEVISRRPGAE